MMVAAPRRGNTVVLMVEAIQAMVVGGVAAMVGVWADGAVVVGGDGGSWGG
jgi:hypothetical protein